MRGPRSLSSDEAKLWRKVAKTTKAYKALPSQTPDVVPETGNTLVSKPQPKPPEMPHLALKRAKAAARTQALKPTPPSKPMIAPVADASGHKKVRRGKLDIDARIDLHGLRQIAAQTALAGIIARTRSEHGRCILVVTGKGQAIDPGEDYINPQPGVIRRRLPEWLNGIGIREHVSGYAPAHPRDGGHGAFYVLLKAKAKT
jgi:DNA-nicking Smr family endonuclease